MTTTRERTTRDATLRDQLERQRAAVLERSRLERETLQDEGAAENDEVLDTAESCEQDLQRDLELALLEIHAEIVQRIDDALVRLDAGTYGQCGDCGTAIPTKRLRALPFALRCRRCEVTREAGRRGERFHASRLASAPLV